ncbi:hypothetical protein L1987_78835 [Smallanthus sonchifolius]|uniref:Uncharacterized protein n=1 Tax=Smallanthus sonchifolius TaxID=185202 RepID=A0ACB8ZDZ0_9ASTR|nr:hypothetical protein L1987_78835 [Smallanthus sonchifolius]
MDKENLHDFPHEIDDAVVAGLTRRFSRSASLQQPLFNFKEKRVFSGSPEPEPTLGRSGRFPADEDAWNLIYAAVGQVSRMKMSMNNRGVIGAPHVVLGGSGTAAKRECAGTGVFLPRGYCNPPESRKRQACSPANLAARMIQASNKTFVPITTPPCIDTSFISHYEMLMSRWKALAGQPPRSNIRGGVLNNREALLPQDWTY